MVRYLFYTIGDLTYQSPLVYLIHVTVRKSASERSVNLQHPACCLLTEYSTTFIVTAVRHLSLTHVKCNHNLWMLQLTSETSNIFSPIVGVETRIWEGGWWGVGGGAVWYISSLGSIFVYVTTIENCIKAWSVFIKARDWIKAHCHFA